jgi:hypothetical protein
MPKPVDSLNTTASSTLKEELGITVLDEPALNCEDKAALEMKYI